MKIHYWGTAAAEGVPSTFCNCSKCQKSRQLGGRNIRTRSQLMIDDKLMVDFNADTYMHSLQYQYDMSKLRSVLITHTHEDHYYPQELHNRQVGFAHDLAPENETLTMYGSYDIVERYYMYMAGNGQYLINQKRVALSVMEAYKEYEIEGFTVIPVPATHGTKSPFTYILKKDGKTAFIMNDTGVFTDEVFNWLKNSGLKFDLVSYDCTHANDDLVAWWGKSASHMGLPNNIWQRDRLKEAGVYKDNTIDIVTHFSHNGTGVVYDDFKPVAEAAGFIVAYDGMEVEI